MDQSADGRSHSLTRRTLLSAAGGASLAGFVAGCVSVSTGTMDLVVENCTDEATDATIEITLTDSGNSVFDETLTVPAESCSDVVDGIERSDVFPEAGTYNVDVSSSGYDSTDREIEFSEQAIEDNSDNVVVTIEDDAIDIG